MYACAYIHNLVELLHKFRTKRVGFFVRVYCKNSFKGRANRTIGYVTETHFPNNSTGPLCMETEEKNTSEDG